MHQPAGDSERWKDSLSWHRGAGGCGGASSTATTAAAAAATSAAADSAAASGDTTAAAGDSAAAGDIKTIESGVLTVGMSADYAPFDWLQNDASNDAVMTTNGSYMNGYDVLMAKKIADSLGLQLKITQVEWDGLILSISSGMVDCAIAGMSITSERMQTLDFSDPYYNADLCVVVSKDSPYASAKSITDLKGGTFTSALNTVWYDVLDQITGYATKGAALDTFAAMVSGIHAKTIDGFCCDIPSAMSIQFSNPDLVILDFKDGTGFEVSHEETDLGIPVKKGNDGLREAINGILSGISQDDRDALMEKAVEIQPASSTS